MPETHETTAEKRLDDRFEDALQRARVVCLVGAPWVGKATLARRVLSRIGEAYGERVLVSAEPIDCDEDLLLLRTYLSSADSRDALAHWLNEGDERRAVVCARAPMHMSEEQVVAVKPLRVDVEDSGKGTLENAGVKVLHDEALRLRDDAKPSTRSLLGVARAVDGVAGLLVCAARTAATFGHDEVLLRVQDDLLFLDVDGTLRARLQVEWARLDAEERRVMAAASIFRGGFTFDCAKVVIGGDAMQALARLSESSLLDFEPQRSRFVVLRHLREFAADHADDDAVRAHTEYFLSESSRHVSHCESGGVASYKWLVDERENLEAVARRGGEGAPIAAWAVMVAASIGGGLADAIQLFESASKGTGVIPDGAWLAYAEGLQTLGRFDSAQAALARADDTVARALLAARIAHGRGGGNDAVIVARRAFERADEADDELARIGAWVALGQGHERTGQLHDARSALETAVELAREHGDLRAISAANLALAEYLLQPDTLPDARICVMEADSANIELGSETGRAVAAGILGLVEHVGGNLEGAAQGYSRARSLFVRTGMLKNAAIALGYQALVDLEECRPAESRLRDAIAELAEMKESYYRALFVAFLGGVHARAGATQHAEALLRQSEVIAAALKSEPLQIHVEVQRMHIGQERGLSVGAANELNRITSASTKSLDLSISLRTHLWRNVSVGGMGKSFRVGYAFPVDLARKPLLARTVLALADHHAQHRPEALDVETLAASMWPGEKIGINARRNRVRVAVATLRQLGLADVLQTEGSGYRLSDAWAVVVEG